MSLKIANATETYYYLKVLEIQNYNDSNDQCIHHLLSLAIPETTKSIDQSIDLEALKNCQFTVLLDTK